MTRALGVDPGTHRLGWGIIEGTPVKQSLIAYGCIESPPGTRSADYLVHIDHDLKELIATYQPDLVGIETLLFSRNVSTALPVAQARGVVLLAAAKEGLSVAEIAPNTVKSTVAGNGKAGKKEVERMVGLLLGCDTQKLLDDTTDALAIAIAALVTHKV